MEQEHRDIKELTETALQAYDGEVDARELEKREIRAELFRLKEVIKTYQFCLERCRPFDHDWHENMDKLQEARKKSEALKYYIDRMGR